MLGGSSGTCFTKKIRVGGIDIVPMGDNNDLPGEVQRLLDRFYAGEGIMGKIAGLQWGDGPRFYNDAIDRENNRFYKEWTLDQPIEDDLSRWDYRIFMHRCLVDLVHMQGFFVKFIRNRAPRIGGAGRLVKLEHIPYQKARLVYPKEGEEEPSRIVIADFPYPDYAKMEVLPVFDPHDPFRYPVQAIEIIGK